jgi:hypothetical protein
MTNMRDKIIDIIAKEMVVDFSLEHVEEDLIDAANAILAALSDRIAPLVWEHIIQELPND